MKLIICLGCKWCYDADKSTYSREMRCPCSNQQSWHWIEASHIISTCFMGLQHYSIHAHSQAHKNHLIVKVCSLSQNKKSLYILDTGHRYITMCVYVNVNIYIYVCVCMCIKNVCIYVNNINTGLRTPSKRIQKALTLSTRPKPKKTYVIYFNSKTLCKVTLESPDYERPN